MIEEVKKILSHFWCELNEDMEDLKSGGWSDVEWAEVLSMSKEKFAQQICQLFPDCSKCTAEDWAWKHAYISENIKVEPKPDESRLLTDEDFHKLHEDFFGEGSGGYCEIDDTDLCYRVAKAQEAKTASILKAQEQERVERILDSLISESKRLSTAFRKERIERPTDWEGHKVLRSKKKSIQLAIGIVKQEGVK